MNFRSDPVPIDSEATYELSGAFRMKPQPSRLIFGVLLYDRQKRLIQSIHVNSVKGTETVLAAACTEADRIIKVKDASSWRPRQRVAFGAEDQLPNFRVTGMVDSGYQSGDIWLIKLREPCGFDVPAGTRIIAHRAGNNGAFPCVGDVPQEWTQWRGEVTSTMLKRWPGATFASVVMLPTLPPGGKGEFFADDVVLRRQSTSHRGTSSGRP
ncbi:MAG: hypothetical protein HN742_09450 [Lentisphaerae bacterium]|nr:hypothetical protein [Lentisphaerota bacterium]MBT5606715.1 hypothetical protein [Lentisphaerota bacterium]MBT7056982.1 hypothetical protein [Lentisphaerota bacterium]MBT7842087.1 hypothetical protein [Lentisphaerota bacterium]